MATGMHAAFMARAVGQVGGLLDRQRIHIGPETNRPRRIADAQPADDPRLADPAKHLIAEFGELLRDQIGSPPFLESELGMGVDIAPPVRQFVVKFPDTLY